MGRDAVRELLAEQQHGIWSHWMKHQFSQCRRMDNGDMVIPSEEVIRWQRQMETPYVALSEQEKESDRHRADRVIAVLDVISEAVLERFGISL